MTAIADFFEQRADWLEVRPVRNPHGSWDVAVIIDGGYGLADAQRNAADYRRRLDAARGGQREEFTDALDYEEVLIPEFNQPQPVSEAMRALIADLQANHEGNPS